MKAERLRRNTCLAMGNDACPICGELFGETDKKMDELVVANKWLVGEDYPQRYTSDQIVVCEDHDAFVVRVFLATRTREQMPGG